MPFPRLQVGRYALGVAAGVLGVAGLAFVGYGMTSAPGPPQPPPHAAVSKPPYSPYPASSPPLSPVPSTGARPLDRSLPRRIKIARIGVDAPVSSLGLKPDGTIEEPPLYEPNLTGWFKNGSTPGEAGPSVILGHVDSAKTGPAVFFKLGTLGPGDRVEITREDGTAAIFQVDTVERVSKRTFPTDKVYGKIDFPGLRLITCGGTFDRQAHNYTGNVIAYAHLLSTRPAA